MSFFKNVFGKREESITSYEDFWIWFQKNEQEFHRVVKNDKNIEKNFFNKLSQKLNELKEGYFYLTGMLDENTVELVLTADGNAKNIVFIEELVNSAPKIEGWKITAHKEAINIDELEIDMGGYKFNSENLSFYSNDLKLYPDEIDITVVHNDLNEENKEQITQGVYIFLDNYLGEIDFLITIDDLKVIGKKETEIELIPICKLKDFLIWRQKEFVEKYEGVRYNTENDTHSMFELDLESGNKLLAVVNTDLLNWDCKSSHPWICILIIKYDGSKTNGMPNDIDYNLLNEIEERVLIELKDEDGYLNIGRQTAENEREIYFVCKDFRKPSKVFYETQQMYADKLKIEFDVFKDKYWQLFERFQIK